MGQKLNGLEPGNGIMTVRDVAEYLRLSEAKIYKLAKEGNVPAVRIGRAWRFKRDLLDDWIRQRTEFSLREQNKAEV